jgi:HD superfamily phosphohydrolase
MPGMGPFPDESRFSVAVRDPVWKHIWLTPELAEITRSEPFLRLYRIRQLGPTEYVYPGATHTRAAHSLGVYHVAQRLLRVLLARGARDWVTQTGCDSFLAAALLHDLGHFPFTHSLKELPLEDHETLTRRIMLTRPLADLIAATGANPATAAAIVDHSVTGIDEETLFFRHLLSGVLDPDKLDYLNRDAFCCGVPYGIQDTDFILSQIEPDRECGIVIPSRAIMSIESILFSKYLMYRSVYWHRQVRMATAMMKKTLHAALERKLIKPEHLYSLDDEGIFALVSGLDFPEKDIARDVRTRNFFRVVAEFPYRDSFAPLENLQERTLAEKRIADFLSAESGIAVEAHNVLVDIPERISFESDLRISDTGERFSESTTVFARDVVDRFTSSLRILRVAVHPSVASRAKQISDIPAKLAKCLTVG